MKTATCPASRMVAISLTGATTSVKNVRARLSGVRTSFSPWKIENVTSKLVLCCQVSDAASSLTIFSIESSMPEMKFLILRRVYCGENQIDDLSSFMILGLSSPEGAITTNCVNGRLACRGGW